MTENYENVDKKNKPFKKIIIILTIIVLVISIVAIFYYLIIKNNAKGQYNDFKEAVNNNHYSKVAEILSNNKTTISKADAKHFVEYVKKDSNKTKFKKEMRTIEKNIKEDNKVNLGTITDVNNKPIITFRKNGKQFLFLDKITITPHLFSVYVKELDNTSVYKYKQDKMKKAVATKNSTSKIGEFFVGKYSVDSEKEFKDSVITGTINGQLFINTDDKGKIFADDEFNQSSFKVKLKNNEKLDKRSLKLYVNNKQVDYQENKVYGKYPNKDGIEVYATGLVDDKKFETNKVDINSTNEIEDIDLAFDKRKIERHKHDTEQSKSEAKDFIEQYLKHLNKAFKKADYDYVKNDIEKDSKLEKHIKNATKTKQEIKYKIKKFKNLKRDNNKIIVSVIKENKGMQTPATYTVKFDDANHYKLIEYKD
jgi:uncharacterized membrane protein YvbJ